MTDALDFSSQAEPVTATKPPKTLDFSAQAEPVPALDLAHADNVYGNKEYAALKSAGAVGVDAAHYLGMGLAGAAGLGGGDPTVQNWLFKNVVDPTASAASTMRSEAHAESPLAAGLGDVAGTLGGFAVAPEAELAAPVMRGIGAVAGKVTSSPLVQKMLADGATRALTHLPGAATLSGSSASAQADDMAQAGVPTDQIEKAYAVNQGLGTLALSAPVSAPGGVLTRAATAEALGLALNHGQQAAVHAVAPDGAPAPGLPDFTAPETYLPAMLGALVGGRDAAHPSAAENLKATGPHPDDVSAMADALRKAGMGDKVDAVLKAEAQAKTAAPAPATPPKADPNTELDQLLAGKPEAPAAPPVPAATPAPDGDTTLDTLLDALLGGKPDVAAPPAATTEPPAPVAQPRAVTPAEAPAPASLVDTFADARAPQAMNPADVQAAMERARLAGEAAQNAPAPAPVQPRAVQTPQPAAEPSEPDEAPTESQTQGQTVELPIAGLQLSNDVPQFKSGADQNGVVEKLGGTFDRRGTGPVQVWKRADGRMEVISGRHRLDLARRSGESSIPAQVYNEADGFTADHAAALDAELNIRDGQGKVKDYVQFFQHPAFNGEGGQQTAESRGLLARATGRRAFTIASKGDAELIAAHSADRITDEAAVQIAQAAPKDERLQALGMKLVQEGKPISTAANTMRAISTMVPSQSSGDMFGFNDSAIQDAGKIAAAASSHQRDIGERLAAITGASKRPELAKKEGIDVHDPKALQQRIGQLRAEKESWDNFATDPAKMEQLRQQLGMHQSELTHEAPSEPPHTDNGPDMFGKPAEAAKPERAAPPAPADMFGGAKPADHLDAATRAKDAERNGRTGGKADTGDGGLFDGKRPEQASIAPVEQSDAAWLAEAKSKGVRSESDLVHYLAQKRHPEVDAAFHNLGGDAVDQVARNIARRIWGNESQVRVPEAKPASALESTDDTQQQSREQGDAEADRLGLRAAVEKALGPAADRVEYLHGYEGLPDDMRRGVLSRNSIEGRKGKTAAMYSPTTGRVFVFTDVTTTPARAVWHAAHEIAGHEGLRALLGDRLNPALNIARQNPTVAKLADEINKQRNLTAQMAQSGRSHADGILLATEEALAELAAAVRTGDYENIRKRYNVEVPPGIRERVQAAIANFLKRLKAMIDDLFGKHTFSDEDVRSLLDAAYEAAQRKGSGKPTLSVEHPDGTSALEQVVYHGTPHTVDKFSLQKIGTGEGAQAYGWGMYFASARDIAETYRRKLTASDGSAARNPDNSLQVQIGRLRQQIKDLDASGNPSAPSMIKAYEARIKELDRAGNLYRVEVPEDHDLLDYDKPLSEQPAKVKAGIERVSEQYGIKPADYSMPVRHPDGTPGSMATGSTFYRALVRKTGGQDGAGVANSQAASEALNAAGIPGLRYKDGPSRNKPLKDVKKAFLAELPEDAEFEDVLHLANQGAFTTDQASFIHALKQDEWLGFDYPAQAISAALGKDLSNFDPSPALKASVDKLGIESTHNYVIWDENAIGAPQSGLDSVDDPTDTPAFRKWFGESKVVDAQGKPMRMYHGSQRPDRIGDRFRASRATSGPMSFFTNNPSVASGYASGKSDTSIQRPESYAGFFKYKPKGSRTEVDIDRAWFHLSEQEKAAIAERIPHVTSLTDDGDSGPIRLGSESDWGDWSQGHWEHTLKQARGNVLQAARDVWLDSGNLFGNEEDFMKVLELGGMPMDRARFDDPAASTPAVIPTYLAIKDPFDTAESAEMLPTFEKAAARQRRAPQNGNDIWDKNSRSASEWVQSLRDDIRDGSTHAWTSIPDWVTKTLKTFGYDGIKDLGGKHGGIGHEVWIPFDDRQVKSATGNNGNFDASKPSILESTEYTPEQQGFMRKAGMADVVDDRTSIRRALDAIRGVRPAIPTDAMIQGGISQFHGLKRAVAEKGGIAPEDNPHLAAEMIQTGSTMEAILLFGAPQLHGGALRVNRSVPGLMDALAPVARHMPQWLGWMVARRAKVLKAQGRENAMSDADIAAGLSLAVGHEAEFRDAAVGYLKLKNAILDLAEQTGIIDPEARKAWDHAEYIPFYRDMDAGKSGPGTRQGLSNQSSGIRTLKGGEAALKDPLSNIIANFTRLVDASMKNRATLLAVDQLGAPYFRKAAHEFKPEAIPLDQIKKHLLANGTPKATIDAMPASALKGIGSMLAIKAPEGDDIVRVMRNGKAEYWHVDDPLLLRSLTAFSEGGTHWSLKPLVWTKQLLTAGATATPDFLLRNAIRDTGEATVTSQDHFIPVWDTLRGAVDSFRESELAQDLMMAGAAFHGGLFHTGSHEDTSKAIKRALRKHGMTENAAERYAKTLINPMRLWDVYRSVTESTEMGSRVSLARLRLKAGATPVEAAHEAKDFLNFQRRGDDKFVVAFTKVIPFLNARIQGADRMVRVGKTKGRRGKMLARLGVMALLSTALYAWNTAMHGDDYDQIPDWDKDANWHIGPGTPYYTRIPKPFELGLVGGTLPERMYGAIRHALTDGEQGDRPEQSWDALVRGLMGALGINPIPQGVKPIMEDVANKDFYFGSPIEAQGDQYKAPSDRFGSTTSPAMIKASKAMASMFSEDNTISPKRLEHLWNGYTAGMGRYLLEAVDWTIRTSEGAPQQPAMALRDFPLIGTVARGASPPRTTRYVDEFYQLTEQAKMRSGAVKEAMLHHDTARAERIEQQWGWLIGNRMGSTRAKAGFMHSGVQELNRDQSQLTKITQSNASIYADTTMSRDAKRAALDANLVKRNEIVRKVVRKLREAERKHRG